VKLRLLIVDQHQGGAELLVAELVRAGFESVWHRVSTAEQLIDAFYPAPDVILSVDETPGLSALDVLSIRQRHQVDAPVIVLSGRLDEEVCVKTLRLGAVDYLLIDRLARLGPAVQNALVVRRLTVDKREAERKERETAGILRGLVAHAPAAISVKSVDGSYLLANRQFETQRGVAPGTLIGRLDADVFPVQQARRMTELDARCLRDSAVMEREEELIAATGSRNLLGVRYPVIDEAGKVFGIGSIHLDITRQKQIEAQLRRTRAEMHSRAEELGTGRDRMRELDRLKTEFVDAVSNELRIPLTSIRGYLELLRGDEVDLAADLARRCLDVIDRNSEHLMGLVEDLLILSRMDAGSADRPRRVSVPEVVAAAVSQIRPSAERAGLSLSVWFDELVPPVAGDQEQLERAVLNLLSNAVKFSPVDPAHPAGEIEVSVSGQDGLVSVLIRDHGIGIAGPDQSRLFSRFFRAAAVREREIPGRGLGLAVVKGIVDAHGGAISVTSTLGRGTTVVVEFPVPS
jgi:PAS domain S-box-containing protein